MTNEIKNNLGFYSFIAGACFIMATIFSAPFRGGFQEEKLMKEQRHLINQIYSMSSGEDRILDAKEKRNLLDKLGFDISIDERECLVLEEGYTNPNLKNVFTHLTEIHNEPKIKLYLRSGPVVPGGFLGIGRVNQQRYVGEISFDKAREYLRSSY